MCTDNTGGGYALKQDIAAACAVLEKGGIILCPTDTVWGIGCDATNEEAVNRLLALKGRRPEQGLIVLMCGDLMYRRHFRILPPMAWEIIDNSTVPITLILPEGRGVANGVCAADGSLAVRQIRHSFCTPLLKTFGRPLVSTSANLAGEMTPLEFNEIPPAIREGVDYFVDVKYDSSVTKVPSKIIKMKYNGEIAFIRNN